jgi:hypothetical protein
VTNSLRDRDGKCDRAMPRREFLPMEHLGVALLFTQWVGAALREDRPPILGTIGVARPAPLAAAVGGEGLVLRGG